MLLDFGLLLLVDWGLNSLGLNNKWGRGFVLFFLYFLALETIGMNTNLAGVALGATLARESYKKNKAKKAEK